MRTLTLPTISFKIYYCAFYSFSQVTDFGVSADLQNSIAMCGTFVGTFKYMSPERIRNQPYSYLSDIWSFGLVMMECVTGLYPFNDSHSNCIEMAQTILDCAVPKLSPHNYSPALIDFIESCLQRDPLRRPSAELLLSAPWFSESGATSYDTSVDNVYAWIHGMSSSAGSSSRK